MRTNHSPCVPYGGAACLPPLPCGSGSAPACSFCFLRKSSSAPKTVRGSRVTLYKAEKDRIIEMWTGAPKQTKHKLSLRSLGKAPLAPLHSLPPSAAWGHSLPS